MGECLNEQLPWAVHDENRSLPIECPCVRRDPSAEGIPEGRDRRVGRSAEACVCCAGRIEQPNARQSKKPASTCSATVGWMTSQISQAYRIGGSESSFPAILRRVHATKLRAGGLTGVRQERSLTRADASYFAPCVLTSDSSASLAATGCTLPIVTSGCACPGRLSRSRK